jgi:hypothetical protein
VDDARANNPMAAATPANDAPANDAQASDAPAARGTLYKSRSVTSAPAPAESTGGFRWFGRRSEAKRDA